MTVPIPPSGDPIASSDLGASARPAVPAVDRAATHWLHWVHQQVSDLPPSAVDNRVREAVVSLVRGMGALALPPMPSVHVSLDQDVVTLRWGLADESVVVSVRRIDLGSGSATGELRFEGEWHRPLRGSDVVCETYRAHTAAHLLSHIWPGLESLRQLAELQTIQIPVIERVLQEADLYCLATLKSAAGAHIYGAEARMVAERLNGRSEGRRELLEILLAAHGESPDGHVFPAQVRGRYLWAADHLCDGAVLSLTKARRESPRWRTGPASPWVHTTRLSVEV